MMIKYRFGFFVKIANSFTAKYNKSIDGWKKRIVGRITIFSHPETHIKSVEGSRRSVVIIGSMYAVNGYDIDAMINELCSNETSEIGSFLNEVSGRFALFVIGSKEEVSVYHDAFGSRSIFYSLRYPGFVASHAGLMAEIFDISKDKNIINFMSWDEYKSRTVKYLPGDLSLWEQVHPLIPNNFLDLESGTCSRYWPVQLKRIGSYGELFKSYDSHIKGLINFLRNHSVLVGVTGGIDSRVVFAAMQKYNLKFSGFTWLGSYVEEKEIFPINKIIDLFGINHQFIDMSGDFNSEVAVVSGLNSGGYRGKSRLAALMYEKFHDSHSIFVRGYGGEILRGFYNISKVPMRDFSASSMSIAYSSSIRKVEPGVEYIKYVEQAFEIFRSRANYEDMEKFCFEPADIFYWEHRMGVWGSAMLNEHDSAVYSLVGMNGRALYECAFSLNDSERLSKKLLSKIANEYVDSLRDIPYF